MKLSRSIAISAAICLSLVGAARADYSFTTSVNPPSPAPDGSQTFGQSNAEFGHVAYGTASGSQTVTIAYVADITSRPDSGGNLSNTDTGTIGFTDTISMIQTSGPTIPTDIPGTGKLIVVGTLSFARSDEGGQSSSLTIDTAESTLTATVPAGSGFGHEVYSLSNFTYIQPTVNAALGSPSAGQIRVTLSVSPTPEPSSLALVAVGTFGLALATSRRLGHHVPMPKPSR